MTEATILETLSAAFSDALPTLIDLALKSAIILGLATIIVLMLRKSSASTRCHVWLTAIAALLALPLLQLALPDWKISFSSDEKPVEAIESESAPTESPVNDDQAQATLSETPSEANRITDASGVMLVSEGGHKHESQAAVALPLTYLERARTLPIGVMILAVWLLVAGILLTRIAASCVAVYFLKRRSEVVSDPRLQQLLADCRDQLGIRKEVRLVTSPKRAMPMTWGWLNPCILLPEESSQWSDDRARAVLLHECAHIRRGDFGSQLITQIGCAFYWCNPLVWLAAWRIGVERERASDDLVLSHGVSAPDYASVLLDLSSTIRGRETQIAAVAMARPKGLEQRLKTVLNQTLNRTNPNMKTKLFILALTTSIVAPLAMLSADDKVTAGQQNPATPKKEESGTLENLAEPTTTAEEYHKARVAWEKLAQDKAESEFQMMQEIALLRAQLEKLEKLNGDELLNRGLALGLAEDKSLRSLYPDYEKLKTDEAHLANSGLGQAHPARKALQAQIDRASALLEQTAEQARVRMETRLAAAEDAMTAIRSESQRQAANSKGTEVRVATAHAGIVTEVAVSKGQEVEKGDLLIRIDDTQARGKAILAEKELRVAKLNVELAADDLKSAELLLSISQKEFETGTISQEAVLKARKSLRTSQGNLERAKAEIESAETLLSVARAELERYTIRSPFDGKIRSVNCHVSEYVMPSSPVVNLLKTPAASPK